MFTCDSPAVGGPPPAAPLPSGVVASEDTSTRPVARLGYSAGDLEAFLLAGERRAAELAAEIAIAEARRDAALRRAEEAPELRRRVAREWLDAWEEANGPSALRTKEST